METEAGPSAADLALPDSVSPGPRVSKDDVLARLHAILPTVDIQTTTRKLLLKQLEEEFGTELKHLKAEIWAAVAAWLHPPQATSDAGEAGATEEQEEEEAQTVKLKKRRRGDFIADIDGKSNEFWSKARKISPELAAFLGGDVAEVSRRHAVQAVLGHLEQHGVKIRGGHRGAPVYRPDEALRQLLPPGLSSLSGRRDHLAKYLAAHFLPSDGEQQQQKQLPMCVARLVAKAAGEGLKKRGRPRKAPQQRAADAGPAEQQQGPQGSDGDGAAAAGPGAARLVAKQAGEAPRKRGRPRKAPQQQQQGAQGSDGGGATAAAGPTRQPTRPLQARWTPQHPDFPNSGGGDGGGGGGRVLFTPPRQLSAALAALVGQEAMSRPQLTVWINAYVKKHGLLVDRKQHVVKCDEQLKSLFKVDSFRLFAETHKLLTPHIVPG